VPVFKIPGPLRSLSGGESSVTVEAADLRSAIDELDARFPGFKGRLLDEDGEPRQFVNLFLNEEDVRLGRGLDSPVGDRDEIAIVPAVAGG
jgi:sulfur-carrier protein